MMKSCFKASQPSGFKKASEIPMTDMLSGAQIGIEFVTAQGGTRKAQL